MDVLVAKSRDGPRPLDRRVARTHRALIQAFVGLLLERNYRNVTIADVVARADVGRSTFYDHFRDKDEILLSSMGWMFSILADAVRPDAPRELLDQLIAHFWDNRGLARIVLAPPIQAKLARALAKLIEDQLAADRFSVGNSAARKLRSVGIAAGQLGMLETWTRGELSAKAEEVSEALAAIARASK